VAAGEEVTGRPQYESKGWENTSGMTGSVTDDWKKGRWPANLIHDGSDEVLAGFPVTEPAKSSMRGEKTSKGTHNGWARESHKGFNSIRGHNDSGGSAARFFYCAKASKKDRGDANTHPTVKPTALMRYLCRLVTPPDGIVLDPFMGSGSTGKAARLEGFKFIGIERDEAYFQIAKTRIEISKS
jgi:site-specific DNA-methyltransferase (adenine-specific)